MQSYRLSGNAFKALLRVQKVMYSQQLESEVYVATTPYFT